MIECLLLQIDSQKTFLRYETTLLSFLQVEQQISIYEIALYFLISFIIIIAIILLVSIASYLNQNEPQELNQDEQNEQFIQNIQYQNEEVIQNNQVFELVNQRFYIPSFKQRQVEDEYLKKFIRDFKNVQQYQEEYNLDGSQYEHLNNQIKLFIPIRGDGNCMFTSIGFQYIYYNVINTQRYQRLFSIIDSLEFKQNYENNSVYNIQDQDLLKQEFKVQLQRLRHIKDSLQLLQQLAQSINNYDGPFYGLLVIFMRNYFRKIVQEFYDTDQEMNFLIQEPELINEIITWEHMYNESDIALKLFAKKEQIQIRCYQKMNVDDKIVQISEYQDDDQNQFQYKIGLAFQPGHYNAILLNS